jgi:DNA-directed RNA polymerase subunit RPC12/RpoP
MKMAYRCTDCGKMFTMEAVGEFADIMLGLMNQYPNKEILSQCPECQLKSMTAPTTESK